MSQVTNIIEYLSNYEYITQLVAKQVFGVERLASRMNDIKNKGFYVSKETLKDMSGKRYTRYSLKK